MDGECDRQGDTPAGSLIGKARQDLSRQTDPSEIEAIVDGLNPSSFLVCGCRSGSGIDASSNTERSPAPSRTGLCRCRSLKGNSSIAQGSPHRGYPGSGTSLRCLNPAGVRFTQRWLKSACSAVSETDSAARNRTAAHPDGTLQAIPYRDESSPGPPTQGSRCAANHGL